MLMLIVILTSRLYRRICSRRYRGGGERDLALPLKQEVRSRHHGEVTLVAGGGRVVLLAGGSWVVGGVSDGRSWNVFGGCVYRDR